MKQIIWTLTISYVLSILHKCKWGILSLLLLASDIKQYNLGACEMIKG